ncbi:MAG: M1 family aminopeptidase [Candidatus Korobacteraceae bacterium]|jgi:hypothetical protein
MKTRSGCVLFSFALLACAFGFAIENTIAVPNTEPAYVQLRHIHISGEAYEVQNLKMVRDVGTIELHSGILCLLQPVQGVVTGAIFRGSGSFSLQSDDPREQKQLTMLTGGHGISEDFEKLVLRFADGTPEELKNALTTKTAAGCPTDLLEENQKYLRTVWRHNLSARLLQPLLAGRPDGFFFAFIYGKKYGRLCYVVDPQAGIEEPEEVALFGLNESKSGIWYSGHLLTEPREGWRVKHTAHESGFTRAVSHKIDASIEKSGLLSAITTETLVSQIDGLRVVPFDLFSKLRVSKVTDAAGSPLSWIQEKHDEDADYFVVLAKPLKRGEQFAITTSYSGKDAVRNEGGDNYYPIARSSWYPNTHLGNYAMYELTLRIPKDLTMAATGTLVSKRIEDNQSVTQWKSDLPLAVAGFNFGDFKSETMKLDKQGVQVTAFANKEIPDIFKRLQIATDPSARLSANIVRSRSPELTLGSMNTTPLLKKSLAEAELAVQLYTDYFGPMSAKDLQITQQTAGNYGQAWPGLVFLPIYYFLDTTVRNQLGLQNLKGQYWNVVEPHEVAHQWWGHSICWASYRDQWMSEGFADFSASLFIQYIRNNRKEYLLFWKDLRDQMVEKDEFGHRPIDVGSVTMGYRVASGKVGGWTGQHILYPKGAYILHMLRMMMQNPKTGDADFKAMMQDLVATYRNRQVSTEDFKAMVEKHMTPSLNAAGNGKMDWFFDEWVYGTEIPSYAIETSNQTEPDGKAAIILKVSQSGVGPSFRMVLPLYFELNDGKVGRLGQMLLVGNQTITQKIPLGATVPKRLMVNYNYDVLSAN